MTNFHENTFCRAARTERETRTYELRLKQYENDIAELKARSDAIQFDAARRIEDNEVKTNIFSPFSQSFLLKKLFSQVFDLFESGS